MGKLGVVGEKGENGGLGRNIGKGCQRTPGGPGKGGRRYLRGI